MFDKAIFFILEKGLYRKNDYVALVQAYYCLRHNIISIYYVGLLIAKL